MLYLVLASSFARRLRVFRRLEWECALGSADQRVFGKKILDCDFDLDSLNRDV